MNSALSSPVAFQQSRAHFIPKMRWFRFSPEALEVIETESVTDDCSDIDKTNDAELIEPLLPVSHRAIAYGDGFFSTMKVQAGKVYWQKYHQHRIHTHATALQLYLPKSQQLLLWQHISYYARIIDIGMIKVIVTRQAQNIRGYGFSIHDTDNGCDIYIGVWATEPPPKITNLLASQLPYSLISQILAEVPIQPAITAMTLQSRISCIPPTLAGLKTLNRLDNVLASAELKQQQARMPAHLSNPLAEGLVQDMFGYWVEGTMSNVFYQLDTDATDAQWFTPPIDRSGVNGVMRQVLMDSFDKTTYPIIERHLEDKDITRLTGLFFCNAVRGIMPVAELIVDDNKITFAYASVLYN
ncbi:aminotransferase class IV [Psychrobacter sp. I-STPA6b]|uniref:aminotransferase class IV n=1 Tax=Psychrobacter sp. I-STPA6b TaxID=2585718 RepID=UPI001D0CD6C8|nr:aminotransferase class IV [Psychrobacter sp. I-STPA6b]